MANSRTCFDIQRFQKSQNGKPYRVDISDFDDCAVNGVKGREGEYFLLHNSNFSCSARGKIICIYAWSTKNPPIPTDCKTRPCNSIQPLQFSTHNRTNELARGKKWGRRSEAISPTSESGECDTYAANPKKHLRAFQESWPLIWIHYMLGPRIAQVINNRKNQHQKTGPGLRFQFRICIYRTPGKDTLCFLSAGFFFGTAKLSGNLRESGKRPLESFSDFFMPSAARKLPFSHAFYRPFYGSENGKVFGTISELFSWWKKIAKRQFLPFILDVISWKEKRRRNQYRLPQRE